MNITVPKEYCINTEHALRREWLDTNGLGGYASSTVIGCHTRKYHGLLVAALEDPPMRAVLLSKLEVSLHTHRKVFRCATNKYPGVFHPTGHKYIERFNYYLFPRTVYRIGDILFEKSLVCIHGSNTVCVRYSLKESPRPLTVRIQPLLAYRDIHSLMKENMSVQVKTYFEKNGFKIEPYRGMPPLFCATGRKSVFYPSPEWKYNTEYMKEERRGYAYQEDLFSPGIFEAELKKGEDITLGASCTSIKSSSLTALFNAEVERREKDMNAFSDSNEMLRSLKYGSSRFIITRPSGERSLTAGYHWFGEWGRDTMIALPGIAFCTGRLEQGAEILDTFVKRERGGLIPNYLGGADSESAYNSADAPLWLFWTVQEYLAFGGTADTVMKRFFPAMQSIITSVISGSNPHIRLRTDGLVETGNSETQLTWMDASAAMSPVTPRHGCPVEINALWYNALMFYIELCTKSGISAERETGAADTFRSSFPSLFWNEEAGCLYDTVRDSEKDPSVRPNQIFAVSLPHTVLSPDQEKSILAAAEEKLVTPFGLRTLSPADPCYRGVYEGTQTERDAAYHQGTVWPWLAGHFVQACLKVYGHSEETRTALRKTFDPLLSSYPSDFGIASIPEIYSGDPPHKPKGCISQAWSHAEVIRIFHLLGKETA